MLQRLPGLPIPSLAQQEQFSCRWKESGARIQGLSAGPAQKVGIGVRKWGCGAELPQNSEELEIKPVSCLYMYIAYSEPTGSPVPALIWCQISTKGSCLLAEFTAATGCQFRPGSRPEVAEHKQNEHASTCKIPEALRQKQARFRVKSGSPGTPPQSPRGQFPNALEHPAQSVVNHGGQVAASYLTS